MKCSRSFYVDFSEWFQEYFTYFEGRMQNLCKYLQIKWAGSNTKQWFLKTLPDSTDWACLELWQSSVFVSTGERFLQRRVHLVSHVGGQNVTVWSCPPPFSSSSRLGMDLFHTGDTCMTWVTCIEHCVWVPSYETAEYIHVTRKPRNYTKWLYVILK